MTDFKQDSLRVYLALEERQAFLEDYKTKYKKSILYDKELEAIESLLSIISSEVDSRDFGVV